LRSRQAEQAKNSRDLPEERKRSNKRAGPCWHDGTWYRAMSLRRRSTPSLERSNGREKQQRVGIRAAAERETALYCTRDGNQSGLAWLEAPSRRPPQSMTCFSRTRTKEKNSFFSSFLVPFLLFFSVLVFFFFDYDAILYFHFQKGKRGIYPRMK
jgi:hypothetical protein